MKTTFYRFFIGEFKCMKNNIEHEIQNLLFDIGVPTNRLGFLYLTYGIVLVMSDYEYVSRPTKRLYPGIADRYKTEPQSVERCVRHAITAAFAGSHGELMVKLFSVGRTPTPTEFISRIYFYIINNEGFNKKEA